MQTEKTLPERFRTKSKKRGLIWLLLAASVGIISAPFIWNWWVEWQYARYILSPQTVSGDRVAIVFGARIYADGRLSSMLADRVETAVQLYLDGRVQKLLVSGDNRFSDYDEPGRMMEYAISRGVPAKDIQPDYGGRRTYDTCYRAREIFNLDSAILVTQSFHLPRALFTCRSLGLEAFGVNADIQPYSRRSLAWSKLREIPATAVALFDVIKQSPATVMGNRIPLD